MVYVLGACAGREEVDTGGLVLYGAGGGWEVSGKPTQLKK